MMTMTTVISLGTGGKHAQLPQGTAFAVELQGPIPTEALRRSPTG
jgi:hypothetical protein